MSNSRGHLYFVGIAGHTMRGLALAARELGYEVSGLDPAAAPPGSTWLDEHHFTWYRDFEPAQLNGVTTLIITGAHATPDSPAIVEARRRQLPVHSYAQFVGERTRQAQVIAVAGTHGKTTTTSLIAWLLESAGRRPDYLVGIRPLNFDSSVRLSDAKIAVIEADEYKASTLDPTSKAQYYHPDTLVLTSIEHDHPDLFPDLAAVEARFREIVASVPASGRVIACNEAENVLSVAKTASAPLTTYGFKSGDLQARNIAYLPQGLELEIERAGKILGHLAVGLYGKHNILNTLAAVATALQAGISFDQILAGAATFKGAYRRFNVVSRPSAAVTIVDDYAHHPTEVATNLEAAKLHFPGRRVVAIFLALQSSLAEGFESRVTDAIWLNVPVLGSIMGGIPLQIVPGLSGYVLDPHNPDAWADRIVELVLDEQQYRDLRRTTKLATEERLDGEDSPVKGHNLRFTTANNIISWLTLALLALTQSDYNFDCRWADSLELNPKAELQLA